MKDNNLLCSQDFFLSLFFFFFFALKDFDLFCFALKISFFISLSLSLFAFKDVGHILLCSQDIGISLTLLVLVLF